MIRSFPSLQILSVVACVVACVLTCATATTAQQRATAKASGNAVTAQGQQIFAARCAGCHGLDGAGSERGPDIATRRDVQSLTDSALHHVVQAGMQEAGMPSFRFLGDAKINAVVQHLRRLQGGIAVATVPGDSVRGKTVFFGKADCSQCHMVNGEGGFIGSDLSSYASARPASDVRGAITEPNKNLAPRNRIVVVTTADGAKKTGLARNEDNFSLQLQTTDGAFFFFDKKDLTSIDHQPRSLMPNDYGSKLSQQELDDLVSYLMQIGKTHQRPAPEKKDE